MNTITYITIDKSSGLQDMREFLLHHLSHGNDVLCQLLFQQDVICGKENTVQ